MKGGVEKNVALFVRKGVEKNANDRTRPVSTRDGPLDQPNEQKGYMDQPCAIFSTIWAVKGHF